MNRYACKIVIILSLLLICSTLIFRFTTILNQTEELEKLNFTYLQARTKVEPDSKLHNLVYKAQQDLKFVVESLPAFDKFPYIVRDIVELIQKSGLNSSGLIFKPIKTPKLNIWQYDSQFSVKGSYADIKSFISDFQILSGINTIGKVSLASKPDIEGEVNLDITISVYCRGD